MLIRQGNQLEKEWEKLQQGEARLSIISKVHSNSVGKMKKACSKAMCMVKNKEEENRRLVSSLLALYFHRRISERTCLLCGMVLIGETAKGNATWG